MHPGSIVGIALLMLARSLDAQTAARRPPDGVVRREILAAEAALERAVVAKDRAALDTLYAADFEWQHWTGERDTRSTWLAFLADSVAYREHTAHSDRITIFWVRRSGRWEVREQVSRRASPTG